LALTSPTGGGRSVGIVRSRTKATEFSLVCRLGVYFQMITEICDRLSSIGSVEVQLLSFGSYVFTPSESSVQMYTQVFYFEIRCRIFYQCTRPHNWNNVGHDSINIALCVSR